MAAALVSEVFPKRARAHASSIFHASSVIGPPLASLAAIWVGANWEYAYLISIIPALLIVWVRIVVKEPEKWKRAREEAKAGAGKVGSFRELLTVAPWRGHALGAMALAAVGLGTFWAVTVAGQDLAREMLISEGASPRTWPKAKFAYGIVQTLGGGLGLVLFGPISARIGRKKTFILFHIAALAITLVACSHPPATPRSLLSSRSSGSLRSGIHAGYAVYFPELFPARLRATRDELGIQRGTPSCRHSPRSLGENEGGDGPERGDRLAGRILSSSGSSRSSSSPKPRVRNSPNKGCFAFFVKKRAFFATKRSRRVSFIGSWTRPHLKDSS